MSEILQAESVRKAARAHALDYYLTALLAPGSLRDDLIVLAAFWGETGRIALSAGEAMLGEVKLQWWHDALKPDAGISGHPVADALRDVISRHGLEQGRIEALLDGRALELTALPFADEAECERYLAQTDGNLLRLCAKVLGAGEAMNAERLLDRAAQSCGRVRVARDLARFAAHGRMPLWSGAFGDSVEAEGALAASLGAREAIRALGVGARQARDDARAISRSCSRRLIDAVLPLALVEPYLRALESKDHDPLHDLADIAPLNRVARLAWARLGARF